MLRRAQPQRPAEIHEHVAAQISSLVPGLIIRHCLFGARQAIFGFKWPPPFQMASMMTAPSAVLAPIAFWVAVKASWYSATAGQQLPKIAARFLTASVFGRLRTARFRSVGTDFGLSHVGAKAGQLLASRLTSCQDQIANLLSDPGRRLWILARDQPSINDYLRRPVRSTEMDGSAGA